MAPSLERIFKGVLKAGSRGALSSFRSKSVDDYDDVPRYPPFAKGFPVVPPERLLADQRELVSKIERALGMTDKDFERLVKPTLFKFAEYVHLLPASEHHHHRGAGGLLRHSLEVAFFATRSSEGVIFEQDNTPGGITQGEPRWRLAAFLSGLLHDSGKPITDMSVVDKEGHREWDIFTKKTLYEWAKENKIDRYFLRWERNRHKRHERMATYAIGKLLSDEVIAYLRAGGKEINQALMDAVTGLSVSTPLSRLMLRADSASVEMDLREQYIDRVDQNAVGIAVERYLVSAMRALIAARDWKANEPGSVVWVGEDAAYVNWRKAAQDVTRQLQKDNVPGIPQSPDTLAEILLDRGLAIGQPVESSEPSAAKKERVDIETGEVMHEEVEPEHVLPYWYVRVLGVQTAIGVGKASFMALKLPLDILYSTDMPPKPHDDIEVITDAQRRQEKAVKEESAEDTSALATPAPDYDEGATSSASEVANNGESTDSVEVGEEAQFHSDAVGGSPQNALDDKGAAHSEPDESTSADAKTPSSTEAPEDNKPLGKKEPYAMGAPGLVLDGGLDAAKMRSLAVKRPKDKAPQEAPAPSQPKGESQALEGTSTAEPASAAEPPQSTSADPGASAPEADADPYAGVMNLDDISLAFSAPPAVEAAKDAVGDGAVSGEQVAPSAADQSTSGQEQSTEPATESKATGSEGELLGSAHDAPENKPDSHESLDAEKSGSLAAPEAPAFTVSDDATEKTGCESTAPELPGNDNQNPSEQPLRADVSLQPASSEKAGLSSGSSDKTFDVFAPRLAKSQGSKSKSSLRSGAVMSVTAEAGRQGKKGVLPLGDAALSVTPRKAKASVLSGLDDGLASAGAKAKQRSKQEPDKQSVRSMPPSSASLTPPKETTKQSPKDHVVSATARVGKQARSTVVRQYKDRLAKQSAEALSQAVYVKNDNVFIVPKRFSHLLSVPASEVLPRLKEIDAVDVRIEKRLPKKVVLFGDLASWLKERLPLEAKTDAGASTHQVPHTLKKKVAHENAEQQPPIDKVTSLIASSEEVVQASTPSDDVADIGAPPPDSEKPLGSKERKRRVLELLDMAAMEVLRGEGPLMVGARRQEQGGWSVETYFTHELARRYPEVSISAIRLAATAARAPQSKRDDRYKFFINSGRFYVVTVETRS